MYLGNSRPEERLGYARGFVRAYRHKLTWEEAVYSGQWFMRIGYHDGKRYRGLNPHGAAEMLRMILRATG